MHYSTQAFTLIELLVVVAIISILASIALPNYQHAQVRAKATAVVAEMRSLSTAIEVYQLDHNTYPPDGNDYFDLSETHFDQMRIQHVLTTPTAYISEIPDDLFHFREINRYDDPLTARFFQSRSPYPYVYYTVGNYATNNGVANAYYLFSFGPDLDFDNSPYQPENFHRYDPTNGVVSDGDIFIKAP